jgi:hypothetical protein
MPSYDLDHLHPRTAFDYSIVGVSTDKWKEWRIKRDRLPNLELLDTHNTMYRLISESLNSFTMHERNSLPLKSKNLCFNKTKKTAITYRTVYNNKTSPKQPLQKVYFVWFTH